LTSLLAPQVCFYPQRDAKGVQALKWFQHFVMTVEYCNDSMDSAFLTDILSNLNFNNSITFEEAMKHPGWRASMTDKIESILKNELYTLVDPPPGVEPIDLKWVFKVEDGIAKAHPHLKSRLVVNRGFLQEEGKDFWETFAPTVKWTTIRVVSALATSLGWSIYHLDVKTLFLHGVISEDIFVFQPPGFLLPGFEHLVGKLNKALYGLRQAPRAWYICIDSRLKKLGLVCSDLDHNLYILKKGTIVVILLIYVDDLLLTGNCESTIREVKSQLMSKYEMTDLGEIQKYLGVEYTYTASGLVLHQRAYCQQILMQFDMTNCRPATIPLPVDHKVQLATGTSPINVHNYCMLIGKLLFLAITRPDISFAVSLLSRYMSAPQEYHLDIALHVLRYLSGTVSHGLYYQFGHSTEVQGFPDANWGMCKDSFKSTGAYVFTMAGSAISWSSKRQQNVSLSSTESECKALTQGAQEAAWIKRLLAELLPNDGQVIHMKCKNISIVSLLPNSPLMLHCDNQSSIKLAKNPVMHSRTKHIGIQHHYVRE
jgi:hypothetical protein